MLFRATRGNCFIHSMEIDEKLFDPETNELMRKRAFVIFFNSGIIETKIKKICDAFGARIYKIPDLTDATGSSVEAMKKLKEDTAKEKKDANKVKVVNMEVRANLLATLAERTIEWSWTIRREKVSAA